MLYDNHGRVINYLRIAVTDRCNLRCHYCMPEEGIEYVDRNELLTFEEIERVVTVFAGLGVNKIRITGGEPFVRRGMMDFLHRLNAIQGIDSMHITTNGTLTRTQIPELKRTGIKSVNLSLDSLDKAKFFEITRRDSYDEVMGTLNQLIQYKIPTKINMVVMSQHNIEDIIPMIELTKNEPISVRFLEEMPFNGVGEHAEMATWDHIKILNYIKSSYPDIVKIEDGPNSTSMNYKIPGYNGSIGIIASFTRLFCGTCNRIRLTPTGVLKTCLYDGGVFNIRDLMRAGATDQQLITALTDALSHRSKDGYEAEKSRGINTISESMATIGG
jgi:molybdenum cofactor biosynthesis protein A